MKGPPMNSDEHRWALGVDRNFRKNEAIWGAPELGCDSGVVLMWDLKKRTHFGRRRRAGFGAGASDLGYSSKRSHFRRDGIRVLGLGPSASDRCFAKTKPFVGMGGPELGPGPARPSGDLAKTKPILGDYPRPPEPDAGGRSNDRDAQIRRRPSWGADCQRSMGSTPRSPCVEDGGSPDCVTAWIMNGPITYITGVNRL
jgi:hypothetical protein